MASFVKVAMVFLVAYMGGPLQGSMGAVYKVGDSAGWTTIGSPDYKKWAASKTFHVGDTILFEYHVQFHNVMQVNHAEFQSCNSSAPIATHHSGNDSITINKTGHYYFICGYPGHCQSGQKVDIRVVGSSSTAAPASAPTAISPSGTTTTGGKAPEQSPKNGAPSTLACKEGLLLSMVALVLAIFAGFIY